MSQPAALLGSRVVRSQPLAGGSINRVELLTLEDGREVVRKLAPGGKPPQGMFAAEAKGLAWLRVPGALRVPRVLAVDEEALVLEYLDAADPVPDFEDQLGRGLARLHQSGAPCFGLDSPNYIATIQQRGSSPRGPWSAFYVEHRLTPMADHADARVSGAGLRRRVDALGPRLAGLLDDDEGPSRLHGDLWAGNLHRDETGAPALIDPAVYGGHREVDLAMMRLFGGFSARVFDAYDEVAPLAAEAAERVGLHQLYPLLVHVALFGGGYVAQVDAILRRHGA